MQLRLQTRIGLGYAVAIATMALVLLLVLAFFQAARHESSFIRLEAIPSIEAANGLLIEVERMENAEFRYFLHGETRPAWTARFDESLARFRDRYDRLAELVHSPEERRLLAEIGEHAGGFVHIDGRMRALIAAGRVDEAQALNRTESLAQANMLREAARRLRDLNQRAIVASQSREDRYIVLTEWLAAAAAMLGVLLAALTWWRSSRDVVRPLIALEGGIATLAAGGEPVVHHPRSGRTRELESLEVGFNRLVASLKEARAGLRQANETLETQVADRTEALSSANARLERNVEELRAVDAVKSRFLAVVSHELLTPINFITGYGSALEDELMGPLRDEQRKAVRRMLEGAQRLTRLVRNVLEATQLETGDLPVAPVALQPGPVLAEAVAAMRPQAEAKRQLLEVTVPASLPEVLADPARLAQVLVELLDNAIKFTAEGGKVRLSASPGADGLVLSVSDTGVGIAPEALPSLFDRFYQEDSSRTRRHGGLGLGLSISRSLVEGMGGSLAVSSRLGEGTTFTVTLPIAPSAARERAPERVE